MKRIRLRQGMDLIGKMIVPIAERFSAQDAGALAQRSMPWMILDDWHMEHIVKSLPSRMCSGDFTWSKSLDLKMMSMFILYIRLKPFNGLHFSQLRSHVEGICSSFFPVFKLSPGVETRLLGKLNQHRLCGWGVPKGHPSNKTLRVDICKKNKNNENFCWDKHG